MDEHSAEQDSSCGRWAERCSRLSSSLLFNRPEHQLGEGEEGGFPSNGDRRPSRRLQTYSVGNVKRLGLFLPLDERRLSSMMTYYGQGSANCFCPSPIFAKKDVAHEDEE